MWSSFSSRSLCDFLKNLWNKSGFSCPTAGVFQYCTGFEFHISSIISIGFREKGDFFSVNYFELEIFLKLWILNKKVFANRKLLKYLLPQLAGIFKQFRYEWVSEVAQSCPTLCNLMGCSLPRSSVHGIFQAGVLEWVAISFSRGSSRPRTRTWVSLIVGRRFTVWATREVIKV